jgi:peptidylprolyl isomerase
MKIIDHQIGEGAEATSGKTIAVHYTGTLEDGKKFDSSLDRGQKFVFLLGRGQVIKGWDQGIAGMRVGGNRRLEIEPNLAYGARGYPPVIPPNAMLIFEIELLDVT